MRSKISLDWKIIILSAALILCLSVGGSILIGGSSKALGGNFAPQMGQQGARYQISACDANSAWIIDTTMGDVYLIYSSGKWKEVGSIMDEQKRIKK
jgi:hypothetical protein